MQFGIFLTALIVGVVIADDPYLLEKPSYLNTCPQTDPNFSKCFAKNFQVVISEWKDGVPGLKTIGTLDPSYFKRISIVEDDNNPLAQINIKLDDIYMHGISNMKVIEASFDRKKLVTKLKMFGKKLKIDSNYDMKGRILSIPLNGNGKNKLDIEDVEISMNIRLKLRHEHGQIFSDIDKMRLEITNIGGFHIRLDNLFNGNKELGDATNDIINQSWQSFYEVMGPAIVKAIEESFSDRFSKMFAFVPVTYFVSDLD